MSKSGVSKRARRTTNREIADVAIHLWNQVDQAHHDKTIERLMLRADKAALIEFINTMLDDAHQYDGAPDQDTFNLAKRLTGRLDVVWRTIGNWYR